MSRIQVSKPKYIELINKTMQEQSRYVTSIVARPVPWTQDKNHAAMLS